MTWPVNYIKGFKISELKVKTKVYDVSTKILIGEFESRSAASVFSGVSIDRICHAIRLKQKCHKNKLNKILAFR